MIAEYTHKETFRNPKIEFLRAFVLGNQGMIE